MISLQVPATGSLTDAVGYAERAEASGYESLACSHIAGRDSFTLLAALAMRTERIALGTAVAPIYHRSPASMAQTAATLDEVSGGRFRLGLGVGHRATMGGWHGQEIGKPVAEMREYVTAVRAILAGEPVPPGDRWNSTFAFTGFRPVRPRPPISLAGLSPAMLRLAGEIADGVLLWACPPGYVRDVVLPAVAEGRDRAGLGLDGFDVVAAVPAAVYADDAGRAAALAGVREELHRYFGLPFYRAMFAAAGFAADLAAYDAAAPDPAAQRTAISEEFVAELCALGGVADVRAGVDRYRAAGATNPLITHVRGTDLTPALLAAAP